MSALNKLFVYGIFLDQDNRTAYGMSDPEYATVLNYITLGNRIVQAVPVSPNVGASLTGLLVTVEPRMWPKIDRLEYGYDRIEVVTTTNQRAYMYVQGGKNNGQPTAKRA